jgi:Hpt domain
MAAKTSRRASGTGAKTPRKADAATQGAAARARAEAAIKRLSETYLVEHAPAALAQLTAQVQAARQSLGDQSAHVAQIYSVAHDMKGQGGAFGMPLLSEIGGRMCALTVEGAALGAKEFAFLDACLTAIGLTIAGHIQDVDSPNAKRVLDLLPPLD